MYITDHENSVKVVSKLNIGRYELPSMTRDELNALAEIIYVLIEMRKVVRQFEADQKLTMYHSFWSIHELYETIFAMAGKTKSDRKSFYKNEDLSNTFDIESCSYGISLLEITTRAILSFA